MVEIVNDISSMAAKIEHSIEIIGTKVDESNWSGIQQVVSSSVLVKDSVPVN